jgi:hypothetical protein
MDPSLDTPAMRLHVAAAKIRLTAAEQAAIETLARQISDWDTVLDTAVRNFNLPNLRRHLSRMAPGVVPRPVLVRLKIEANASATRNLLMISAQRRFKETCLDPLGADAVFFKGVSLASQYYPDLGLRPCRDIDVLVQATALRAIVLRGIEAGYSFVVPGRTAHPLVLPADIDAALHYRKDAVLL